MTHLIGDIGNTETKLCILNKSFKIVRRLKIDTLKINNQYYFKKIIFSFVQNKIINKKALFSSVVPSVFFAIKKYFKKYFNIQCQELKQTYYSKIIKINANKKQVGSDRIANAIGAYCKYKSDCIVLDFGTATTFDVINKGTYWGGIIAPGVNLSLRSLASSIGSLVGGMVFEESALGLGLFSATVLLLSIPLLLKELR